MSWFAEDGSGAAEIQITASVGTAQSCDEFATKHSTQDFHRQEEAGVFRVYSALIIWCEATSWYDAMHVGMPPPAPTLP
jgi:hypothetical protein